MTGVAVGPELNVAPGSIVVVRDEEWLVTSAERGSDGWLIRVRGLSEPIADTTAAFYTSLDDVEVLDPAEAQIRSDGSSGYRDSRLWLESMLRKTPILYGQQSLTVSTRMLLDSLAYQRAAVAKALDPSHIRPRILLANSVGLGKTIEIGMILSELVRLGRGKRILIVTSRHGLEQMQHELWCRFALPFVRLDSAGIQKVRQKLPATRSQIGIIALADDLEVETVSVRSPMIRTFRRNFAENAVPQISTSSPPTRTSTFWSDDGS